MLATLLLADLGGVPSGSLEGPEAPAASSTPVPAPLDPPTEAAARRPLDAYVDTGVAASAAVVSSMDGGERSPLDPRTVMELSLRAAAAASSTAVNVWLIRHDVERSVDLAAVVAPAGGGVVVTTRF